MTDWSAVREALAAAASTAGVPCLPYAPDNPSPPIAFIDSVGRDYQRPGSFTIPATCRAVIVALRSRHDMAASVAALEADIDPVTEALTGISALTLISVDSGVVEIGKAQLPAVSYTVEFFPQP